MLSKKKYIVGLRRFAVGKSARGIVTAQSTAEEPPEDGREKRPRHVWFYTYQRVFNILLVLNVEVSVF